MTHISDDQQTVSHDWHLFDIEANLQCRQLREDTFQLKSDTHFVTLTKEEFQDILIDPENDMYLTKDTFSKWDKAKPIEELDVKS
jgi:hypothetical protein